jgi:ribosome maturation factor RimP
MRLSAPHPDIGETRFGLAPEGAGAVRRLPNRLSEIRILSESRLVDIARLVEIIEPEVKALGFDLVRVKLFGRSEVGDDEHALQIMAENPKTGQLVLDDCVALSHRISDRMDALEEAGEVLIDEAYRLEVSSPGIDRPLTRPKDYVNWAGHEARINLTVPVDGNRKTLHGEVVALDGESVEFEDRKSGRVRFALADVHSARLVLTDKLIAATRPLDASGADEVIDGADEILEEQED